MGENRSVLTALGAILGLILFVYVILQGVNYFRQGAAEFDEMQRQAGAPILLSETLRESGEVAVATGEELTATVATTETTAVASTTITATEVTATEEMTATEAAATTALTDTATVTGTEAVASAETLTGTAAITDTVDAEEGEVAATAATTTTEAITATAAVTEEGGTGEGAVAESTAITTTEVTTATAEGDAPPAEEVVAEEPAEAPAAEAVAMAVPAPEEVAPIFTKAGCIACHVIPDIPGAAGAIGPNLSEIGVTGATRIEGYTVEEYLHESILNPNAFIAPECPTGPCLPGLMVQNLGDVLTPEEIDMVVAYLASMGVAE